ncbi:hypothetical protein ABZ942_31085 [Nocardia sp. NPDC046473]|uniref:hypothetical protein n=1 Tax=Nocardia sp. NPDC046473 TaxID=3155733 RepID=UPI0033C7C652
MTPETPPPQRRWLIVGVLAVAALLIAAIALIVVVTRDTGGNGQVATTSAGTPSDSVPSGTAPPGTGTTRPSGSPGPAQFPYQPLFPFSGTADADAWVRDARPGGHQPWHDDAGTIALMFTQKYLGYQHIDKVVNTAVQGDQAQVAVGFDNPNGAAVTASVLHLVRIGSAPNGPWEVVGTGDTTLALTTPVYGATVSSPISVGGWITGVDESLRVRVIGGTGAQPAGTAGPIPAGGTNTPWAATVSFTATCPATLTVAVGTGGHVADVERFAVTGVRC